MENNIIQCCLNCAKRNSCKSLDELKKMENELFQYVQNIKDIKCFGGDPRIMMKEVIETNKDMYICQNYKNETIN